MEWEKVAWGPYLQYQASSQTELWREHSHEPQEKRSQERGAPIPQRSQGPTLFLMRASWREQEMRPAEESHTWQLHGYVVQSPGVTEIGLKEVNVGLTDHDLLAKELVVHHFHYQGLCVGLLHRHELQAQREGTVRPLKRRRLFSPCLGPLTTVRKKVDEGKLGFSWKLLMGSVFRDSSPHSTRSWG